MGEEKPRRFYSRAKSAQMFERIRATEQENKRRRVEEQILRQTDPFEQAKLALQRRGIRVYSNSVHVPRCRLIVVGVRLMTKDQVIAHAERFCPRNPQGE